MPVARPRYRFSITSKLLLWCLILVGIFYFTTQVLVNRIRDMVEVSGDLVNVHYEVDTISKNMLEVLISLEENMKRYEILKREVYKDFIIDDLTQYETLLDEAVSKFQDVPGPWVRLAGEYAAMYDRDSPEVLFIPYETVGRWSQTLLQTRQTNEQVMRGRLFDLNARASAVARWGIVGLMVSMGVGLLGSFLIAYRVSRSLKEVRRGIRSLGQEGDVAPLRVKTGDELGELAAAFNEMAARLRREEQMRSDFISMLSHEIRTPLTSIREAVELVTEGTFGELAEGQNRMLDIARKETERLSGLLARLMKVSSMEAGSLRLALAPVEVEELVAGVLERVEPAAKSKSVLLQFDVAPGTPSVMADQDHVRQAMLNVVGNAVKFSPPGKLVHVTAKAHGDDEGPEFVVFCVSDQGPGIPADEHGSVFRKYYRHASVRESVDGVGLGLSISKNIVEAHGGRMWIESGEGVGSSFCFTLPTGRAMH